MSTETITAGTLRVGDVLIDGEALLEVTSVRLEGAPPQALVELAGVTGRRHYRAVTTVRVHRETSR